MKKENENYAHWQLFINPQLSTEDLITTLKTCSPIITDVEVVTRLPGKKTDVCDLKLTYDSNEEIDDGRWLRGLGVILEDKLKKN
jgi:hypothetical protein